MSVRPINLAPVNETAHDAVPSTVRGLVPAPPSISACAVDAATTNAGPIAGALLSRLAVEHPMLSELPARERLLAAAWLGSYRSARTRRAYAGDLAAWLDWLREIDLDVLHARRAQLAGRLGSEVAKRVDTYAAALYHQMTVAEISDLDVSYTPPLGSPWDAVQLAAQAWESQVATLPVGSAPRRLRPVH